MTNQVDFSLNNFFRIVASIVIAAFIVVGSSANAAQLLGVRFGPDGDKTRIVFDLVGAPEFTIGGDLEGEGRLIVEFTGMQTGPEGINGFAGKGLIRRYAYAPDGNDRTKFILEFKQTAKIFKILTLEPNGSVKKHRLVVDLLVADKPAFLASLPKAASSAASLQPAPASADANEDVLAALLARENLGDAPIPGAPIASKPVAANASGPAAVPGNAANGQILTNRAVGPQTVASDARSTVNAPSLKPIARLDRASNGNIASADIPVIGPVKAPAIGPLVGPPAQPLPPVITDTPQRTASPLITIVIDPGHGGTHPGAIGPSGILEKDVNFAAALVLQDILVKTGRYNAILTRTKDTKVELDFRANIAHDNNAHLFISLHADGNANRELRGSSVYTLSDEGKKRSVLEARSQESYKIQDADMANFSPVLGSILFDVAQDEFDKASRKFADLLLARLKGVTPLVKNAKRSEDLKVLLRPDLPAVLLEMAFISNPSDEANLTDPNWRKRTMGAVARAVDDYFELNPPLLAADNSALATGSVRGIN